MKMYRSIGECSSFYCKYLRRKPLLFRVNERHEKKRVKVRKEREENIEKEGKERKTKDEKKTEQNGASSLPFTFVLRLPVHRQEIDKFSKILEASERILQQKTTDNNYFLLTQRVFVSLLIKKKS